MLVVRSLRLAHFRNFSEREFIFDETKKFIVLQGNNGAGKTSIIESLYYGCYLKSFRTPTTTNLIQLGNGTFFIKIECIDTQSDESFSIIVGSNGSRKNVKFNNKPLQTHKELLNNYRVVSLTELDLDLIKGAPQLRRDFISHSMMLVDPEFVDRMRVYRRTLNQRNALLYSFKKHQTPLDASSLSQIKLWTEELWKVCQAETERFKRLLVQIQKIVNSMLSRYCAREELVVALEYLSTLENASTFDDFWNYYQSHYLAQEYATGRGCWGLHLDDIQINLTHKTMKHFASRGQQKLIIFLFKLSQVVLLGSTNTLILLDDFITDFDQERVQETLSVLQDIPCQVIISSPFAVNFLIKETLNVPFMTVFV